MSSFHSSASLPARQQHLPVLRPGLRHQRRHHGRAESRAASVSDAAELARFRAQDERHRRNSEWPQAHWADLLPQARGKFIAVAGQEAFIADTPEPAWAWADSAHPADDGAFVRYVRREQGRRIYASLG